MWSPCSIDRVWELIVEGEAEMSTRELRLWDLIWIHPAKWQLPPWGNEGGGFWVVAIFGRNVVWYNDLEEGFNRSPYTTAGIIGNYRCNQDGLELPIRHLLEEIDTGFQAGWFGPPISGEFRPS